MNNMLNVWTMFIMLMGNNICYLTVRKKWQTFLLGQSNSVLLTSILYFSFIFVCENQHTKERIHITQYAKHRSVGDVTYRTSAWTDAMMAEAGSRIE